MSNRHLVQHSTTLVQSELEGRDGLDVAARRLYRFGFDRVTLPEPSLGYEPRASCQCKECAALWVGSKSGPVMRIDLRIAASASHPDHAVQTFLSGNREARAVLHLHACKALTRPDRDPASFLLVGRDDGLLDIVREDLEFKSGPPRVERHAPGTGFHLDSWARRTRREPVDADGHIARSTSGNEQTMGITAIEAIADPAQADAMLILVATRYPQLYILRARGGTLELRGAIAMPGWIDWIVRPEQGRADVLCISRGGDIARIGLALLAPEKAPDGPIEPVQLDPKAIHSLALHPTAVLPFGERGLLIGSRRGLALIREPVAAPVAVPVTRSAVLCLDRAWMPGPKGEVHYVTMGLEDGRLRVIDAQMIDALGRGERPAPDLHRFWVEMGESVLALETLRIDTPAAGSAVAFVLALRVDHSMALFKVAGFRDQEQAAVEAWRSHVRSSAAAPGAVDPSKDFAIAWRIADELARAGGERDVRNARSYLLIEVVLDELRRLAADRVDQRKQLVALAITLAATDDPQVLRALSQAMGRITGGDVHAVLELSRAVLRGLAAYRRTVDRSPGAFGPDGAPSHMTMGVPRRWAIVASTHLGELHRLAGEADGLDRARMVSWARFVRKYVVRGHSFATKRKDLLSLVQQNHASGKYFDALIYQARLAQTCYDLRWEQRLDAGIAQVHPVRFGWSWIAVCVTWDARVVFVGSDGKRFAVRDSRPEFGGTELRAATPFAMRAENAHGWAARHRTLASAVEGSNHGACIVVAADGDGLPPAGLAVIDVKWGDADRDEVRVLGVEHVTCVDPAARVHALHPLGGGGVFIAGLESPEHPVGKLWSSVGERGERTWSLELARERRAVLPRDDEGVRGANELSPVAPGRVPTRALAVASCRGTLCYLVVAGSDDGQVRAFRCSASDPAASWQIDRWDQVTNAVTSIVLGRHDAARRSEIAFSCYLSTTSAETLALSIVTADDRRPRTFSGYEAVPLWRDTHDGTVIATRLWDMPRYKDGAILVVATQQGRLVLYNHAWLAGQGEDRVSATKNYWFRGKRLARVTLPSPLTALSLVEDQPEVLAAGPHGRLYSASLMFLQDSDERDEPDQAPRFPPAAAPASAMASHDPKVPLPPGMWAQLRHLLTRSAIDWMLQPAPDDRLRTKLELCELVPIDAVTNYALRQTVEPYGHWHRRNGEQLKARAHELLGPLDPDRPADAAKIKIVLRSLSRAFLSRDPEEVARAIRNREWLRHEETATACEILAGYLTHALVTPGTARLRVVVIKELLRVGLLHHMSKQDAVSERIRIAAEDALTSCLRDDDRIVRIETLRALSVMLRNVRVMARPGSSVVEALFPDGPGSLTWALDPLVVRLARFPSRKTGSAMASSAWYRISVLTQVFRLFPQRTLALCDYVTRARGIDDTVRICDELLGRPGPADGEPRVAVEARFELYLLRVLERGSPDGASELERYVTALEQRRRLDLAGPRETTRGPAATTGAPWYTADDREVAERLLHLLHIMALMWNAKTDDGVVHALDAARALPGSPATAARVPLLDALHDVVTALIGIGDKLGRPGADRDFTELLRRDDPRARIRDSLPAGFATVVTGILESWHTAHFKPVPAPGKRIGKYRLAANHVDERTRLEFAIDDPPHLDDYVIKVMLPTEPIGHERFLPGARLNHRLARSIEHGSRVVEVIDVLEQPCPAYVMRKHDWLEDMRVPQRPSELERAGVCERVAEDISRALQAVHAEPDGWHGAVKPCNIAVIHDAGRPEFRLGHFDRGYRLRGASGDATARDGVVPHYLALRASGDERTLAYRQWEDVVSLLLVLYELLTRNTVDPGRYDLRFHRRVLDEVNGSLAARPRTRAILGLLRNLFSEDAAPFTARDVVEALRTSPPPPAPSPWVLPRDLEILWVGAAPRDQQLGTTTELQQIQEHLANSAHGRGCRVIACSGALINIVNMLDSARGDLLVHVSCHGHPGELSLPRGAEWRRPGSEIIEMFRTHGRRVRGVVLSACHAGELAEQLARVVDVVVHGVGAVPDASAIAFTGFYKSLADGESVETACDRGNLHVRELGDAGICRDIEHSRCETPRDGHAFKVVPREGWPPETVRFF